MTTETPHVSQPAPTPSWRDRARALWPDAVQINGGGPYAVLVACQALRITLCPDLDAAEQVKDRYDEDGCDPACVLQHHRIDVMRASGKPWTLTQVWRPAPSAATPKSVGVDVAVQLVRDVEQAWQAFKGRVGFDVRDEVWLRVTFEGVCRDLDCLSHPVTGSPVTGTFIERRSSPWTGRLVATCPLCGLALALRQVTLAWTESEAEL